MMEIREGALTFSFPDHCEAGKYDDWAFYRNQFRSVAGGSKAVDILCLADDAAWLVLITTQATPSLSSLSGIGGVLSAT